MTKKKTMLERNGEVENGNRRKKRENKEITPKQKLIKSIKVPHH